jgi:Trypsin-like peptidase domain
MPRVFDYYADSVVYIYGSLADAKSGEQQGGSGFIVTVYFQNNPEWGEVYIVTNTHVVSGCRTPVVRFNRNDGKTEYFESEKHQWILHPDGDDVSVLPFEVATLECLKVAPIPLHFFITHEIVDKQDVGIGDDTFMIGRFISHEGKQQNMPAIRFGNIAMMPKERIGLETGISQEGFLVESRSLPGYSGSPVFLYSTQASTDMSQRKLEQEMEKEKQKERERLRLGPDVEPRLV